jgi:adhesin transport system membrane fusion protein
LLLRVDPTRFVSSMLESRAGETALQSQSIAPGSLTRGTAFSTRQLALLREAPGIVAHEMRLYESRKAEINAQTSIYQSQLVQRQQELNEVRAREIRQSAVWI